MYSIDFKGWIYMMYQRKEAEVRGVLIYPDENFQVN